MNEGPITYDEVVRAAIRILREGKNISKPLIREELGSRGSHTTIQKHLDTWRESLSGSDLEVLPPSMPVELTGHIEAFWNAATSLAESQLAGEWERAKLSVDKAEEARLAALDERDIWQEHVREKDVELASQSAEIAQLSERLRLAEERLAIRDQEYQGLLDRLDAKDRSMDEERKTVQVRIDLLDSRHKQDMEAAESRWDAEKAKLQEQARAATERAELEVARSDKHEVYFLNEVRKTRDDADQAREQCRADVNRLEQELLIARRREEAGSVRLGKLEERLMALQDEHEALETANKDLTAQLEDANTKNQALLEEIKELRKNDDR